MPLGTLDRTPPSLFKQGPSLLSQFVFFTCLSLFLMFADTRFEIAKTLRSSIATVLAPVNRVLSMPGSFVNNAAIYFESQATLKESEQALKQKLLLQSQRASQVEVLGSENAHLRKLLKLQSNLATPSQAAQVLYAVSDPYSRKVVIDKGSNSNIALGSPVMDAEGIIGQVVRVYPLSSEVALLIDNEQATPVLNVRTGIRSVMYGRPGANTDTLELRFVSGTADVQAGDELTTSGMDGVYPAGLAVAKIDKVERRTDSAFAKITCQAKANLGNVKHVMVLQPTTSIIPNIMHDASQGADGKKGTKKMIMPRGQEQLLLPVSGWFLWGSLLTALVLNMLPVGPVAWLPDWVALFLAFWAMHQPQKVGLGVAMIFGLLVDVQQATLLGQHALVYCCLVLAVLLLRRRLVWYSLVSQATQLLPLFALAHVFLMLMQLLGDATFPGYTLILAPLLEAVVWPIISILLLAPQRRTPERDVTRPL